MSDYEIRFGALARLYGEAGLTRLQASHVCVVGLGGVGSWAVEALARSGVGRLTLIDMDEVCLSNANRQLHALSSTVGTGKASVLASRIAEINPQCDVQIEPVYFTESNADTLLKPSFDYVLDAIDGTKYKSLLIAKAKERNLPIITCGGAGGRIDPGRIRVDDLARTINDPLMLEVRKRLRRDFGFPKFKRQKFRIDCVFSDELPVYPQADGSVGEERVAGEDYRLNCDAGFGTATFVTGAFGFRMASEVVRNLAVSKDKPDVDS